MAFCLPSAIASCSGLRRSGSAVMNSQISAPATAPTNSAIPAIGLHHRAQHG